MIFGFGKSKRIVGVGLDGLPHSLAERMMRDGVMPNLRALTERGTLKRINSVFPTVSGVAWSAFQTGKGPAEFGVFGFVELRPDFSLTIPNSGNLKCETLWQRLRKAGKSFAALGVPMTYPIRPGDGLMVSGFLAPELDERAVSGPDVLKKLKALRYEIDINPGVAATDPEQFRRDLMRVAGARQDAALKLLGEKDYDLFFLHVMDTDRLHHFLWPREGDDATFFFDFYRKLDDWLGRVVEAVGGGENLMICSDHGFCELNYEVQLNRWLREHGYLDYVEDPRLGYQAIKDGSRAVSLVPGRVHILRKGRWDRGSVAEADCDVLRGEIMEGLRALRHPETDDVVCKQVMRAEEVFQGPYLDQAPEIIVDPCNGFDLKAKLGSGDIFETGPRTGMHTYDDAMLLCGGNLGDLAAAGSIQEVGRLTGEYLL